MKHSFWIAHMSLAILCILLLAQISQAQQALYESQVLFNLAYGPALSQMGIRPSTFREGEGEPYSVKALSVPSEDMIFVVDAVQRRIKRFNAQGNLIFAVESKVQESSIKGLPDLMTNIASVLDFASTPQGHFYITLGQSVEAFDVEGYRKATPQHEGALLRGWDRITAQLTPIIELNKLSPNVFDISTDQYGYLYLTLSPADNAYNVHIVKFTPDLTLVGVVPGYTVGWNGKTYGFVPNKPTEPNDKLIVWSVDGRQEKIVELHPPENISQEDYTNRRWTAVNGVFIDKYGHIYLEVMRSLPKDQWVELSQGFVIDNAVSVYKFDESGKFLTKLSLTGLPFFMHPSIAVDTDGNIYHLRYNKDKVEFVVERRLENR